MSAPTVHTSAVSIDVLYPNLSDPFQLPLMLHGCVVRAPVFSSYVTMLLMLLLVVLNHAPAFIVRCRFTECVLYSIFMLLVNEGFSPGLPLLLYSGLLSSVMSSMLVMLGCEVEPR